MTHYRLAFFEALRQEFAGRGLQLEVAYGEGTEEEAKKRDSGELSWATRLSTRYFAGSRICWQPFGHRSRHAALTVVTAENKLVYNLVEQYRPGRRVALWGHGANLQGAQNSLRERFKRRLARRADWWFAYTQMSVPLICKSRFPVEKITVLDNAVDTSALALQFAQVSASRLAELRAAMALQGSAVGIYIGSLYKEKRIEFLLQAAEAIRRAVPQFELLIVGAGPDAVRVQDFCRGRPWVHYLGPLKGRQKAEALALSHIMLNPGLVGLGILDAFACRVPMLTTDCGVHSPEIVYLENGSNGLMTADSADAYVSTAVGLLCDEAALENLRAGCGRAAARYTLANMARNFADGVERCLALPARG